MEIQPNALNKQEGGDHYKNMAIQPVEFITKNKLGFCEGNIIKYACRHKHKDGVKDVKKIIHYAELLKDMEYTNVLTPEELPGLDLKKPNVTPVPEKKKGVVSGFGIDGKLPESLDPIINAALEQVGKYYRQSAEGSRLAVLVPYEALGNMRIAIRRMFNYCEKISKEYHRSIEPKTGVSDGEYCGTVESVNDNAFTIKNVKKHSGEGLEIPANAATLELALAGLKAELKEVKAERHALELKNDELRSLIGVGCINKDWKLNEDFDKIIEFGLQAIERLKATCINKSCTYYTFASKQEIDSIYIAFKRMNNCCENLLKNKPQKHPGEGLEIHDIGNEPDTEADALRLQEQIKKHNESKEKGNNQ